MDNRPATNRTGGPRSRRGKARSSRNAVKHGMRSDLVVIDQLEDPDEWEAFRDGIVSDLEPEGAFEHILAEEIAFIHWKIRRVAAYQAYKTRYFIDQTAREMQVTQAYANRTLAKGELPDLEPEIVQRFEYLKLLPPDEELTKIMRYESHLHRRWIQTQHELEALQARRKGGHSPLARLDVSGSPSP